MAEGKPKLAWAYKRFVEHQIIFGLPSWTHSLLSSAEEEERGRHSWPLLTPELRNLCRLSLVCKDWRLTLDAMARKGRILSTARSIIQSYPSSVSSPQPPDRSFGLRREIRGLLNHAELRELRGLSNQPNILDAGEDEDQHWWLHHPNLVKARIVQYFRFGSWSSLHEEMSHRLDHGDYLELTRDPEWLIAVASQNGMVVEFASEDMKHNKDVMLAAVSQTATALTLIPSDSALRCDRDIARVALRQSSSVLADLGPELQNDRDMVLEAVQMHGQALQHAPADLKNDKELVLAAVKNDGCALAYASDDLKNDPGIVNRAVSQNQFAITFASHLLQEEFIATLANKTQQGKKD